MNSAPATTTPTAGHVLHWAARYDLLVWLLTHGRSRAFREHLVDLAHLSPGESVLDVGCGTGSLAIAAERRVGAEGQVVGIDPSPEMIARATGKAARAGVDVNFKIAVAEALPFPDAQFDVVLSTLMLHHLPRKVRQQCAGEIRRVLTPQGRVLVVDFGQAPSRSGLRAHFHRHGHVTPRDIMALLEEAGLTCVDNGPVGVSSLQFVLAVPAPGSPSATDRPARESVRREGGSRSTRSRPSADGGGHLHRFHGRTWIVALVVAALIAAHLVALGLAFGSHMSLAVVAGVAALVVVKYGWWRFRRSGGDVPPNAADSGRESEHRDGA